MPPPPPSAQDHVIGLSGLCAGLSPWGEQQRFRDAFLRPAAAAGYSAGSRDHSWRDPAAVDAFQVHSQPSGQRAASSSAAGTAATAAGYRNMFLDASASDRRDKFLSKNKKSLIAHIEEEESLQMMPLMDGSEEA